MLLEGKEAHVGCAYMNLAGKADLLRQLCVQEINQSIKKKVCKKSFFLPFHALQALVYLMLFLYYTCSLANILLLNESFMCDHYLLLMVMQTLIV